jgi:peptidoglycan hydrolase-like protein with peptidoglycan-binding domain
VELVSLEKELVILEFKVHAPIFSFNENLSQGMSNVEVKNLQIILNYVPFTQIAATGPGAPGNESTYFGPATKKAVIEFQNLFVDEVLTPAGLTSGNGYVGALTREELNVLCGQ